MAIDVIQDLIPFYSVKMIDLYLYLAALGLALLYAAIHAPVAIPLECRLTFS